MHNGISLAGLKRAAAVAWSLLRRMSGDDAYERYVAHVNLHHPLQMPPGRTEFEQSRMEQKWNRISRCC